MNKRTDDEIRALENQDLHPRVSLLEQELNVQLLDERYLQTIPWYRKLIYKLLPTEATQLIEALLIQHKYDAVLSYYERVGLPLAYMQKLLRTKTPHVLLTTWFSSNEKVWFLKRVKNSLAKIVTWSSNQYEFGIHELGIAPDKIRLVKRGTDQRFWRPFNTVETNMICSAGMEMRDYPTLVEALRPLDIPCHIAASKAARGQIYDTVKRLYEVEDTGSNITIGPKSYPELRELYAQSRFVVVPLLPTDTDNGLTVILEAMAMGKAVICSRVEGQVDVIQDGKTGIYVPQGDPKALREAIQELWNHPQKAKAMGQAARKYIEDVHNLEQFVAAIKSEVQQAAALKYNKQQQANIQEAKV